MKNKKVHVFLTCSDRVLVVILKQITLCNNQLQFLEIFYNYVSISFIWVITVAEFSEICVSHEYFNLLCALS